MRISLSEKKVIRNLAGAAAMTLFILSVTAFTAFAAIDASKAQSPWGESPPKLEAIATMIVQCAEKVAREQLARFAPGQDHRIVIRLDWGKNDARNREKTITRMN